MPEVPPYADDPSAGLVAKGAPGDNAAPLSITEISALLKRTVEDRFGFVRLRDAYHGDTIGSVSVGGIDLFHATYRPYESSERKKLYDERTLVNRDGGGEDTIDRISGIVGHYPHCHVAVDIVDETQRCGNGGEVSGTNVAVGSMIGGCEIELLRHDWVAQCAAA